MTSSSQTTKRHKTYVRLIGEIQHALHAALAEESERRGLNQTGMAEALDTSKSFISRKMSGTSNMTLETLADLAFALDRIVEITLRPRIPGAGANYFPAASDHPVPQFSTSSGSVAVPVSGAFGIEHIQ